MRFGLGPGFDPYHQTGEAAAAAEPVGVTIDFSGVPDTDDYVAPELDASVTTGAGDIDSGRLNPTAEGEASYKVKQANLDLDGITAFTVTMVGADSAGTGLGGLLAVFLCDSHTPGNLSLVSSPAGLTGYMFVFGDTNMSVFRVVAGTDTELANDVAVGDPGNADVAIAVVITGSDVTFTITKGGQAVTNGTVVDSNAARISNFLSVGFSLRAVVNGSLDGSVSGFTVAED